MLIFLLPTVIVTNLFSMQQVITFEEGARFKEKITINVGETEGGEREKRRECHIVKNIECDCGIVKAKER